MMTLPDFEKKQIVYIFLQLGEKVSFRNDNLLVSDSRGKIRLQTTCYRIFILCIIGSFSLTSGIIQRSHKFAFPIVLMTGSLKIYERFGFKMEGNVLLRRKQYKYEGLDLAIFIVKNKIENQLTVLKAIRSKSPLLLEDMGKIKTYIESLKEFNGDLYELLGIEGNVAKIYFKHEFMGLDWKGRKPRAKLDYLNSILDIGYSILFNFIDSLISIYGFDEYCGILHKEFYMRKSLVCDIMEPFRPIIDIQLRKSVNLGQFKETDFLKINNSFKLNWDCNKKYVAIFTSALFEYKTQIFSFIQNYYRAFMKDKPAVLFLPFTLEI